MSQLHSLSNRVTISSYYGPFYQNTYWSLNFQGVRFRSDPRYSDYNDSVANATSFSTSTGGYTGIIVVEYSSILLPSDVYYGITDFIAQYYNGDFLNCTDMPGLPVMDFLLSDHWFTIHPTDYVGL